MIIHSLLQQLSNDGFGTVNEDLQPGSLPINAATGKPRNGIALALRGMPVSYLNVDIQAVDFYVRNTNKLQAVQTAQDILEYLQESFSTICNLPDCPPYSTDSYSNVMITPVTSVEWVGDDDNGGTSYVVSGEVQYKKD